MRRRRKTKEEVREARRALMDKAAQGRLVFPSAVKEIRDALDLTQAEFAQVFHLTRRQVAEMESGTANATLETINKIIRPFRLVVGIVPPAPQETDEELPSPGM